MEHVFKIKVVTCFVKVYATQLTFKYPVISSGNSVISDRLKKCMPLNFQGIYGHGNETCTSTNISILLKSFCMSLRRIDVVLVPMQPCAIKTRHMLKRENTQYSHYSLQHVRTCSLQVSYLILRRFLLSSRLQPSLLTLQSQINDFSLSVVNVTRRSSPSGNTLNVLNNFGFYSNIFVNKQEWTLNLIKVGPHLSKEVTLIVVQAS